MKYKLLALDLDGTLLSDNGEISPENLSSIEKASKAGTKVIISTGRSYTSAKKFIYQVNSPDPAITYTVAVIQNHEKIIRRITIDNELTGSLLKTFKDMGYYPIIYLTDDNKYFENLGDFKDGFLKFSAGTESNLKKINNLYDRSWDEVIRISVAAGEADIPILHSTLRKKYGRAIKTVDTYFSCWNFYLFEILDKSCSKSIALDFICSMYGIDSSEVITVGDNNNDLDMIRWAGLGAVMKNGLADVLIEADYITEKSNNENGVSEVIEKFIL
ncbi:MAG TPA: HAD family phosphatase [Spirochaetes bacterium]|nr:HAD family phosphatase [Spirochaetota bacterium]